MTTHIHASYRLYSFSVWVQTSAIPPHSCAVSRSRCTYGRISRVLAPPQSNRIGVDSDDGLSRSPVFTRRDRATLENVSHRLRQRDADYRLARIRILVRDCNPVSVRCDAHSRRISPEHDSDRRVECCGIVHRVSEKYSSSARRLRKIGDMDVAACGVRGDCGRGSSAPSHAVVCRIRDDRLRPLRAVAPSSGHEHNARVASCFPPRRILFIAGFCDSERSGARCPRR